MIARKIEEFRNNKLEKILLAQAVPGSILR
jgi:hypothetical protein